MGGAEPQGNSRTLRAARVVRRQVSLEIPGHLRFTRCLFWGCFSKDSTGYKLFIFNYMAERGGFEPPIQVLARITV